MMLQKAYARSIRGIFFYAFLVGMVTLLICDNIVNANEVPAFFLKIAKVPTLPRVGRSSKFQNFLYKPEKHIPRIGRNSEQDEEEAYTDLTKRRIDYPSKVEDWSWENFPLAIEGPRDLWRALAGYSRDGSDDIDNEVWQRKKRTETEPVVAQEK